MNVLIYVQVFLYVKYQEEGFLGHREYMIIKFIRYCQIAFLIYVLAHSVWVNLFLHIFTNMWYFPILKFFSDRRKIVFYCILYFPHYYWSWVSSCFSLNVLLISCVSSIRKKFFFLVYFILCEVLKISSCLFLFVFCFLIPLGILYIGY